MPKISFGLSAKQVYDAIDQIEAYKADINAKCQRLAERLAEEGVYIARVKIADYEAIYSSNLLSSIKSDGEGATYRVYTECEYAPFVEFGFGVVGAGSPHPDTSLIGWKYDVNQHGEKGWFYYKDGQWHWSKGQPSRPFMYETAQELRDRVAQIAEEVFKGD